MGFLKRNWVLYLVFIVAVAVVEPVLFIVFGFETCRFAERCFGNLNPNYSPLVYNISLAIFWIIVAAPIVGVFIFLVRKTNLKDTIKLYAIFLVLGFIFTLGQLWGMERAEDVAFLAVILLSVLIYSLYKIP